MFFRIVQSKVQSIDGTKDGTFAIARVEVASTWTVFIFNTASNVAIAVLTAVFLCFFGRKIRLPVWLHPYFCLILAGYEAVKF